jgi:hypothetical protein
VTWSLLYGVRSGNVEETATALAARLACTFQERDSHYIGVYRVADIGSSEVKVVAQPDPEGDPLEDEFEEYRTLVYVVTKDADFPALEGVATASGAVERLRKEEWDG